MVDVSSLETSGKEGDLESGIIIIVFKRRTVGGFENMHTEVKSW
jgi:hypothetical protein